MAARSRRFTFTLNNYPTPIPPFLEDPRIKRGLYGKETGASGTPHLQGYLETKNQVRLPTLHTLIPGAHWEVAKGSPAQNKEYCSKSGDVTIVGSWEDVLRANLKRKAYTAGDILQGLQGEDSESFKNTSQYLFRKKMFDERIQEIHELKVRHEMYLEYKDSLLKRWQKTIISLLLMQDRRKIMWVVDSVGNSGKSHVARLLSFVYGYDLFDGVSSAKDISYLISPRPRGFVFDVTRQDSSHFSYQTLEQVKNGFVMSGKYAGIKRLFKPVPVVVFANFEPDRTTLSADRWDIHIVEYVQNQAISETLPPTDYVPPKEGSYTTPEEVPQD